MVNSKEIIKQIEDVPYAISIVDSWSTITRLDLQPKANLW